MLGKCKRLLLCNGAHLGDLILSTSILPVIKAAYPKMKIGFLIGSWALPVVQQHQDIDWVHIFDHPSLNRSSLSQKKKKRIGDRTWHQAIREIQNIGYDLAIDLYYFYKANSGKLLAHAKISERIGFWASPAHFTYTKKVFWDPYYKHIVENHGELLRALGIKENYLSLLKPILHYHDHIEPYRLPYKKGEYLLIHIGVGDPRRQWNTESWCQLAKRLETLNYPLVIIGLGKREQDLLSSISSCLTKPFLNLHNQLSWRQLIAIVKEARLLVGLESMAGHVAAAIDTPAVLIYGFPENCVYWRPYNPCCHLVTCPPDAISQLKRPRFEAISKIQVNDVFDKISEVLNSNIHV